MAMDFIYAEETVCWIDVGESPAATQLKCASIQDLKTVSNIRTINITLSLHRKFDFFIFFFSGRKCNKKIFYFWWLLI